MPEGFRRGAPPGEEPFPAARAGLRHVPLQGRIRPALRRGALGVQPRLDYHIDSMKIAIIGATGHIGTYLVPRLVQEGHEVVCVSRARRMPYRDPGIWQFVKRVECDREAEEAAGTFGKRIAALEADAVIDLICFTRQSAEHLVSQLEDAVGHYVCCGTIWVHGHSEVVPTTEAMPRRPFGDYGIRKAEMEAWLLGKARAQRVSRHGPAPRAHRRCRAGSR